VNKVFRNHAHWGAFLAEVEDGRIVRVRSFERDPDPSPLIEAVPAGVHSQVRVARPMVREGWLAHGPGGGEGRGRDPFVPVTWERALDLVAGELTRVKRDHGHDAMEAIMAAKEISVKKHVVRLSGEERERLEALIRKGKSRRGGY
jgi:biotin/methionine sulfoxide reductase